jgi:molybdopterin-guanine dinucleotide biosynthesis protein A
MVAIAGSGEDAVPDVTGIVLAGGESKRFRGRNKLDARLGGKPLLHHSVATMAQVCSEIIVQVGRDGGPPNLPEVEANIRVGHDLVRANGPLAGLSAALKIAWTPYALVAGGDMPFLEPRVLQGMVRVLKGSAGVYAVVLADAGWFRPLPAAIRVGVRAVCGEILKETDASLRALVRRVPHAEIPEADWRAMDPTGRTLADVDTPEDLERLDRVY